MESEAAQRSRDMASIKNQMEVLPDADRSNCVDRREVVLPRWNEAKRRFFGKPPHAKGAASTLERALAMSGLIGAIAAPAILGLTVAAPAVVSGMFTMPDSVINRDCLRLLASFCALNVVTCISGFTFMIGRHLAAANQIEELRKQVRSTAISVDDLHGALDAREIRPKQSGGKRRDVPRTWSGLSRYLAVNPRFLREVGIRAAGGGNLRLDVDPEWVEMWIDRLRNPELDKLEFVLFVDRNNPIIAEATGRTLLRFAGLIQEILRRGGNVGKTKLRIYMVESAEVQRSFFLVRRKVAGRSQDMVLQYSRSVEEGGHGAMTDIESVEPITDEEEMARFVAAAGAYLRVSRSSSVESLLAVFRDILGAEVFRSLSPANWIERIDAIYRGVPAAKIQGSRIVDNSSSEFTIQQEDEGLFAWERGATDNNAGATVSRAGRRS
jgi:hypothetical protein